MPLQEFCRKLRLYALTMFARSSLFVTKDLVFADMKFGKNRFLVEGSFVERDLFSRGFYVVIEPFSFCHNNSD